MSSANSSICRSARRQTTAARLAIDSPASSTLPTVAGYAVAAVIVVVGLRLFVERLDPESL